MTQEEFDDVLKAYGEEHRIIPRAVMYAMLSDAYGELLLAKDENKEKS
jgi:hypothetical protein